MPEIVSSGRAANSARCARAFLSLCPNRDRVGLRQPRCLPDDGPDVGGGVLNHWADGARTELEANLKAAGALERYQYWSDKLERLLQQQRSRGPAMTVTSRNLQVITGRAAREGARERVCFAKKNRSPRRKWPGTTCTTSCASRPSAGIVRAKRLISLKATVQKVIILCTV